MKSGKNSRDEDLPEKLLRKTVKLCLENTERFIKDSMLLLSNHSYGHALALAVLGKEELAKALIYFAYSEGVIPIDFLKEVGRTRDSHMMKLSIGSGLFQAYQVFALKEKHGKPNIERLQYEIKTEQKNKEKGLYVDLNLEKEVVSSPTSIRKDEVEKYLNELKAVFESFKFSAMRPLPLTQSQRENRKAFTKKLLALAKRKRK